MSDEEEKVESVSEIIESGGEESEAISGGPGSLEDTVVHPDESELPAREEETVKKPSKPKFKFKDQGEAERAHSEAMKRMHEATEESARLKKMLAEGTISRKPAQVPKAVWQREREEFEKRKAEIALPEDRTDPEQVEAYNNAVADLYFEIADKYRHISSDERAATQKHFDDTWGWITTEAKKFGIDDEQFDIVTDDPDKPMKGSLSNVFLGVAQNPAAFGINIYEADGRPIPLGEQVKMIALGINRFIDAIVSHRQNKSRKLEREKNEFSVLRRGSTGPGKKGREEDETIETFADQINANRKNRRRVKDLHGRD